MAEEAVTSEHPAEPGPVTHTTIIRERGSSGSGMGILLAVILLIAILGGIYLFSRNAASENARNDAISQAASDVGNAANKAGDAAQDAARNAQPQQ